MSISYHQLDQFIVLVLNLLCFPTDHLSLLDLHLLIFRLAICTQDKCSTLERVSWIANGSHLVLKLEIQIFQLTMVPKWTLGVSARGHSIKISRKVRTELSARISQMRQKWNDADNFQVAALLQQQLSSVWPLSAAVSNAVLPFAVVFFTFASPVSNSSLHHSPESYQLLSLCASGWAWSWV